MISTTSKLFFSYRATSIIVNACRLARHSEVLLPALYCAEVSEALEDAGLTYRCYDVPSDLSDASDAINSAYDCKTGAIIVLHPFGLSRSPKSLLRFENTFIIEDGCHSLRTAYQSTEIGSVGDLTVFSLRKEFGWQTGGFAAGNIVGKLSATSLSSSAVALQWQKLDFETAVFDGRKATKLAADALTGYLPVINKTDVLSVLPLKSTKRDYAISKLRDKDILAWRWIKPLKNTGANITPQSFELRKKLFLVPLPVEKSELEKTLEQVEKLPLEPWE